MVTMQVLPGSGQGDVYMTGSPGASLARAISSLRNMATAAAEISSFSQDATRNVGLRVAATSLELDARLSRLDGASMKALLEVAEQAELPTSIKALSSGALFNVTEQRSAAHMLCRAVEHAPVQIEGVDVAAACQQTRARMLDFATQFRAGTHRGARGQSLNTLVNLGVGGSDLGGRLVTEGLRGVVAHNPASPRVEFVSSMDGVKLSRLLQTLDADRTLFLISSKSFSTLDTFLSAETVKDWYRDRGYDAAETLRHFAAVSSQPEAMMAWGIPAEHQFLMSEHVGGRFSVSSAIGLPVAVALGAEVFERFLAGMRAMDEHFQSAPPAQNMPVLLGLIAVWNRSVLECPATAILPYSELLASFPAYVTQLDMESLGKRVRVDGTEAPYPTGGVILGEVGPNAQHAFMQLLHQGQEVISAEFILIRNQEGVPERHNIQTRANCEAQAKALAFGYSLEQARAELEAKGLPPDEVERLAPHKVHPGNRPSVTISMDRLTPETLGALVALYEHKTFVQAVIWGINPFDQWGVELGKRLAKDAVAAGQVG